MLKVQAGLTKEAYKEAEHNGSDNEAPVPRMIVADECNAQEHKYDAITGCTTTHQHHRACILTYFTTVHCSIVVFIFQVFSYLFKMLCVDSSRLCMSGLSLCDLCLCYSIFGSQFFNKYLLTYLPVLSHQMLDRLCTIYAALHLGPRLGRPRWCQSRPGLWGYLWLTVWHSG